MASRRQLNGIWTIWPDVTALLKEWKSYIERADSWSWGPGFHVNDGEGGRTVNFIPPSGVMAAVVTTAIDLAPDADTLGEGIAILRMNDGADLTDGEEVTVYSNYSVTIPVGKRITVAPYGPAYILLGSDCVTS